MSEIIKALIGAVASIFIIVVGIILMSALYQINPFMAVVGILLLLALAVVVIIRFIKS